MKTLLQFLFVFSLVTTSSLPSVAQTNELVGRLGDPQCLVFHGVKICPPEQIRDELRQDFDVILAAHPSAPVEKYLEVLQRRILAGYHHSGFPNTKVSVDIDRDHEKIHISIVEGPRYQQGDVRVVAANTTGAARIDGKVLIKRLENKFPPADAIAAGFSDQQDEATTKWVDKNGSQVNLKEPVWKRSRPAPFDEETKLKLRDEIKSAFKDIGFEFAEFHFDIVPVENTSTAYLVVRITDEGASAIARQIEIVGNRKNSREDLLKFLKINEGTVLSRGERIRIERELWECGRFVDFDVSTIPAADQNGVNLKIRLVENADGPKVNEPFSDDELALLKCRKWMNRFNEQEYDLVVQLNFESIWFEFVVSPRRGAFLGFRKDNDPSKPMTYLAVLSPESIAVYSADQKRKFVTPPLRARAYTQFDLSLDDVPEWENKFRMNIGLGHSSFKGDGPPPAFELVTRLEPAFFVSIANDDEQELVRDGNELRKTTDDSVTRIDLKTGRLISYQHIADDKKTERVEVLLTTKIGFYEERLNKMKAESAEYPNVYRSDRPYGSTFGFVLTDDFLWERFASLGKYAEKVKAINKYRHLLGKLANGGVLQPWDDWITSPKKNKDTNRFQLNGGDELKGAVTNYVKIGAIIVLQNVDEIFPRESWPWTTAREVAFVVLRKSKYASRELSQLYENGDSGPLCHLTVARLLEFVNKQAAATFAQRGLERLVIADFQNDFELLLARDHLIGRCVAQAAEVVRDLDEDSLDLLATWMFAKNEDEFRHAIRILQDRRDEPVLELMPEVLMALWDAGLRNHVEWALRGTHMPIRR